jgi:hypothetical protein
MTSPNSTPPTLPVSPSLALLSAFLSRYPTVRCVRFQGIDLFGVLRVRIVLRAHAASLAAAIDGGRLSLPPFAQGLMVDELRVPDAVIAGVDRLWPDWASLRVTNFGVYGGVGCCASAVRGE